jgi:hypothetical protein
MKYMTMMGMGLEQSLSSEPAQVEGRQGKPSRITPEFSRRMFM